MTNEDLQALVAQNSQDIASMKQMLGTLISDVIGPLGRSSVVLQETVQENSQVILENSQRITENSQRIAENGDRFRMLLAEAREDRMKAQARFDAQQAEIKALLQRFAPNSTDAESA